MLAYSINCQAPNASSQGERISRKHMNHPQNLQRPSRWSVANWPVRWKVFAIVLVPLVLAGAFGGLRIHSSFTEATNLRRAAERTEMVPAIANYMAALDGAMLASSTGGDPQAALSEFDSSKQELQRRLSDTDNAADLSKGVSSMIADGQALMDKVTSNSITLFERITTYAPILLTAEDAINGSVRVGDERVTAETLGLSRAVGARGGRARGAHAARHAGAVQDRRCHRPARLIHKSCRLL